MGWGEEEGEEGEGEVIGDAMEEMASWLEYLCVRSRIRVKQAACESF